MGQLWIFRAKRHPHRAPFSMYCCITSCNAFGFSGSLRHHILSSRPTNKLASLEIIGPATVDRYIEISWVHFLKHETISKVRTNLCVVKEKRLWLPAPNLEAFRKFGMRHFRQKQLGIPISNSKCWARTSCHCEVLNFFQEKAASWLL